MSQTFLLLLGRNNSLIIIFYKLNRKKFKKDTNIGHISSLIKAAFIHMEYFMEATMLGSHDRPITNQFISVTTLLSSNFLVKSIHHGSP